MESGRQKLAKLQEGRKVIWPIERHKQNQGILGSFENFEAVKGWASRKPFLQVLHRNRGDLSNGLGRDTTLYFPDEWWKSSLKINRQDLKKVNGWMETPAAVTSVSNLTAEADKHDKQAFDTWNALAIRHAKIIGSPINRSLDKFPQRIQYN
ncbi:hypothetical protein Tco_1179484 [Tanacetum coccineum]